MNFVIPMAGHGSRFVKAGYQLPKMLLPAHGKTCLEWSVDSLPLGLATNFVFVGFERHRRDHPLEDLVRSRYEKSGRALDIHWLPEVTRGQAETVWIASRDLDPDKPLVIFNIDTVFDSQTLGDRLMNAPFDGVLGAFQSTEPRFSFAKTDSDGFVMQVTEKEAISDLALTGMYHFNRTGDYNEIAEDVLGKDERTLNEFYVAPLYNKLIARGARLVVDRCESYHILGTPEEYEEFFCSSRHQ